MKALPWVYADANMHQQCPNCRAEANDYCRRPDGHIRAIPCLARMSKRDLSPETYLDQLEAEHRPYPRRPLQLKGIP